MNKADAIFIAELLSKADPLKNALSLNLIFRGTRDGFRALDFHEKCDDKGPTITIVKDVRG